MNLDHLLPWTGSGPCTRKRATEAVARRGDVLEQTESGVYVKRKLTDRQKEIVLLYGGEGMNMAQIAARLGITASAVDQTLDFACDKLRLYNKKQLRKFAHMFPDLLRIEAECANDDGLGSTGAIRGGSGPERRLGGFGTAIETPQTLAQWCSEDNRSK